LAKNATEIDFSIHLEIRSIQRYTQNSYKFCFLN